MKVRGLLGNSADCYLLDGSEEKAEDTVGSNEIMKYQCYRED